LRSIFGTTSSAGKVIFFDAIPTNPENLVMDLDVMNPHYSDYYQGGNTPPADYLNPCPVFFLTIAPNSKFLFAVASEDRILVQQAQTWLQTALRKMGVGAKTTAGYGLWR
jgi:CRISPR-associated protein Cmr6